MSEVDVLIVAPKRLWRSVVVKLPFRGPDEPRGTEIDWQARDRLKVFAKAVAAKFDLPKPRVMTHMLKGGFFCYLPVYEGEGTEAEKQLFKEVRQYVLRHKPRLGKKRGPGFLFQAPCGVAAVTSPHWRPYPDL